MSKTLLYAELAAAAFTLIGGSALHFVYAWSGNQLLVGLLAPINESTWEHLKMLFYPQLLVCLVEVFCLGQQAPSLLPAKALAIPLGMLAIIASFYTYTGIIGTNYLWADILTFVFGVVVTTLFTLWFIAHVPPLGPGWQLAAAAWLLLLAVGFLWFTPYPPHIQLFLDPVTGRYGL